MAKKDKKNNKNLIIGICAAVLLLIIIIVAAIFATTSSARLNDSYFASDSSKYVLTVDGSLVSLEGTEYTPVKAHTVYKYAEDKITDVTSYIEFADEASAKAALPTYKEAYTGSENSVVKSISTNGKYIVIVATEEQYADLSASEVKQQIDIIEAYQNGEYTIEETEDTTENE